MSSLLPKKILIIQTAFIGDVILATGALERVHRTFPETRIDVLVRRGNESLFANHPFISKCWVWEKKERKFYHLWKLIQLIRAEKYDLLINLQRFFSSGLLTVFSGARETRGFSNNPLSFFFSKKYLHALGTKGQPGLHETERNHTLVDDLCGDEVCRPVLYPSAGDELAIVQYLEKPFITISPASVWYTKQVPAQVWIDFIRAAGNLRIYLLGGPGDELLCNSIIELCSTSRILSLAGKLSLLQSAALMKHAAMNYTNDSAPLHLCSAVNAPVTAVFCSTIDEFGFGPVSDQSYVVEVSPRPDCKPCGIHGFKACPLGHFNCGKINTADLLEKLSSN
jgi:ADP-heptose:LPS heptosyltransferase